MISIFAYLDPGTGSAIIQAVIGGAVAIGIFIRIYWHKIVSIFSKGKDASKSKKEDLRDN